MTALDYICIGVLIITMLVGNCSINKEEIKMVPIVLFAIIGSVINPGVIYWVFFGLYCVWTFLKLLSDLGE